jgi:hypothetical protein
MAQSAFTIIRSAFLDFDEVNLGCLVPDTTNPVQDFWPEKPETLLADQVGKRTITNLRELLGENKYAGVRTRLSHLFSTGVRGERGQSFELIAPTSTLYSLKHPRSYFTRLCGDDNTKKWMEETLRVSPIFLVVGLVTVTHAHVRDGHHKSKEASVGVEVPITEALTSGASAIVPFANVLDVGLEVSGGTISTKSTSFFAAGERIIGVQYRKVHFRLFSRSNVEEAKLKSNQWTMFLGGDRAGSDEIIEADLQDSTDLDDLELEDDDSYDAAIADDAFVFLDL